MKILIVDDSALDRKLQSNLIKKSGVDAEIMEAADGQEGLKILSDHYKDIKLILLDWQMPMMNGPQFMEGVVKVKQMDHIRIIMVTASGSEDNKRLAYKINPNLAGYVVKPYKSDFFIQLIQQSFNDTKENEI